MKKNPDNKTTRTPKAGTSTINANKISNVSQGTSGAKKASLEKTYGSSSTQAATVKVKKKSSSIVAASKASFAEKYGSADTTLKVRKQLPQKSSTTSSTSETMSMILKKPVTEASTASITKETLRRTAEGPPLKTISSTTANNTAKAHKTHSLLLPLQKDLKTKKGEDQISTKVEQEEENYDEDDFEEDYQSDFEEVASTDEEEFPSTKTEHDATNSNSEKCEHQEESLKSGLEAQQGPDFPTDSSESDEELQKSSSNSLRTQTGFFRRTSANQKNPENKNDGQGEPVASLVKENKEMTNKWVQNEGTNKKPSVSRSSFNFEGAKSLIEMKTKLTRSSQLMNMIMLHRIRDITIFHSDPSREKYVFSGSRTLSHDRETQVERSSSDQSEQTDKLKLSCKWTQRPPMWSTAAMTQKDKRILREEALGAGTEAVVLSPSDIPKKEPWEFDEDLEMLELEKGIGSSWTNIAKFITRASRKVLYVLESQKRVALTDKSKTGSAPVEVIMNRGLLILNNLEMDCLICSGDYIACANYYPLEKSRRKNEAKSVITIWSLKEPSRPKYLLRMWGKVSSIEVFVYGHAVIAGGTDGGLAIWDLDESTEYHKQYQDQVIRIANIDTSLLKDGHKDIIVGIKAIVESEDTSKIISIDKYGTIKIWSLFRSQKIIKEHDNKLHTAYWSKLSLSFKTDINLSQYLGKHPLVVTTFMSWVDQTGSTIFSSGTMNGFTVMGILLKDSKVDKKRLKTPGGDKKNTENGVELVGDTNQILEGPIVASQNLLLQKYYQRDAKIWVTSVDFSSFLDLLIVASKPQKKIQIYSVPKLKLVHVLNCESEPIKVHFSRRRISVFYLAFNHCIHIYDLLVSDKAPWKVVPINKVKDFAVYSSLQTELTILLASNEMKVSTIGVDLKVLNEKENQKLEKYMTGLVG